MMTPEQKEKIKELEQRKVHTPAEIRQVMDEIDEVLKVPEVSDAEKAKIRLDILRGKR